MLSENYTEELFNQPRIFVTGTDTEVGKTYVSALIVKAAKENGKTIFPFKPISAGTNENGINEDAAELYDACDGSFSIEQINPIVFADPIAPHIAAARENKRLSKELLDTVADSALQNKAKALIEGAGGWLLPLNERELLSDWVAEKQWPVVMVVGIKLGCLNHALLTAQAIEASGTRLIGWVANFVEGENEIGRENLNYLKSTLNAPLLFEVAKDQMAL